VVSGFGSGFEVRSSGFRLLYSVFYSVFCLPPPSPLRFFADALVIWLLQESRRGGIGRRAGLKIQYWQQCVGSTPSVGMDVLESSQT
jgi:hypothetical protein